MQIFLLMMQASEDEVRAIQVKGKEATDLMARTRSRKYNRGVVSYEVEKIIPRIQVLEPEDVEACKGDTSWDTCTLGYLIKEGVDVSTPYETWGL